LNYKRAPGFRVFSSISSSFCVSCVKNLLIGNFRTSEFP